MEEVQAVLKVQRQEILKVQRQGLKNWLILQSMEESGRKGIINGFT